MWTSYCNVKVIPSQLKLGYIWITTYNMHAKCEFNISLLIDQDSQFTISYTKEIDSEYAHWS